MIQTKLADFRAHWRELVVGFVVIACVFVAAAAVSVALDVHAMRVANMTVAAQLETTFGSRLDALNWKADTFNTSVLAMSKTLASGLTQVRVQVAQASTDQQHALAATTKSTAQAVEKTLAQTTDVLQAAAAAPAPIVQVEPAKTPQSASPQVTVNPVLEQPATPKPPAAPEHKSALRWRWLRRFWPFHHARAAK